MGKTAFIFPGQGSEYVGMVKDFYNQIQECRELIERANEMVDFNLLDILFRENKEIHQTQYTQVALLTAECCILKAVTLKGIQADILAGFSLGEYAALVASNALNFEDAISLVRKRGIYMRNQVFENAGGMAIIIGVESYKVEQICKKISRETNKVLAVSGYNSPEQTTISGEKQALERAMEIFEKIGTKRIIKIKTEIPFHSMLLKPVGVKLGYELENIEFNKLEISYMNNVEALETKEKNKISKLLQRHVYSPVQWSKSIGAMLDSQVDLFYEIGPGNTLARYLKDFKQSNRVVTLNTVSDIIAINK